MRLLSVSKLVIAMHTWSLTMHDFAMYTWRDCLLLRPSSKCVQLSCVQSNNGDTICSLMDSPRVINCRGE